MTKHTPSVVYNKLFEDGDYYITDEISNQVGFDRNSIIIHPCSSPQTEKPVWADMPFNITLVLPHGECEMCFYCGQKPSDELIAVYKLHNFDKFATDEYEEYIAQPWGTHTRKFPSRIM